MPMSTPALAQPPASPPRQQPHGIPERLPTPLATPTEGFPVASSCGTDSGVVAAALGAQAALAAAAAAPGDAAREEPPLVTPVTPQPAASLALDPEFGALCGTHAQALSREALSGWLPGAAYDLSCGQALSRLLFKQGAQLDPEERRHVEGVLTLSAFQDEFAENGVMPWDVDGPGAALVFIVMKAMYAVPGLTPEHVAPATLAAVEYQRACQPGKVCIWDDARTMSEAAHPDGSRTFRMTKTIVPMVLTPTLQMRVSQVADCDLDRLAHLCDGARPQKGLLLERTKRDTSKQDWTRVAKSVILYHWPGPSAAALVTNITVVVNTSIPSAVTGMLTSFGTFAAREVAETAVRTRIWFAEKMRSGGDASPLSVTALLVTPKGIWDDPDSPGFGPSSPSVFTAEAPAAAGLLSGPSECSLMTPLAAGPAASQRAPTVAVSPTRSPRRWKAAGTSAAVLGTFAFTQAAGGVAVGGLALAGGPVAACAAGLAAGGAAVYAYREKQKSDPARGAGAGPEGPQWRYAGGALRQVGGRLVDARTGLEVTSLSWRPPDAAGNAGTLSIATRSTVVLPSSSHLQGLAELADATGVEHNIPPLEGASSGPCTVRSTQTGVTPTGACLRNLEASCRNCLVQ